MYMYVLPDDVRRKRGGAVAYMYISCPFLFFLKTAVVAFGVAMKGSAINIPWAQHALAKQAALATPPNRHGGLGSRISFLDLAPDTRNQIYELVFRQHSRVKQHITVSVEKGAREVPAPLSRTCRQVRSESLPYFFGKAAILFVATDEANLDACKQWLAFTPEYAVEMIQSFRLKHAHRLLPLPPSSTKRRRPPKPLELQCSVDLELTFDPTIAYPTTYRRESSHDCIPRSCSRCDCRLCEIDGGVGFRMRGEGMLEDMWKDGKVTSKGLEELFGHFSQQFPR